MKHQPLFDRIVACALKGERCPMNYPLGPINGPGLSALARAGHIRIEVFMHNWRVVTILSGEHAGKQTQSPPKGKGTGMPYRTIDARTSPRRNDIPLENRREPWKPGTPR